ncbi:MAG: AraC family transcriptional regulator [Butyricicoccus sp.]
MFQVLAVPEQRKYADAGRRRTLSYIINTAVDQTQKIHEIHKHIDITEISIVYQGRGLHTIGGTDYCSEPGDILLYNVGQLHQDKSLNGEETMKFYTCGILNLNLQEFLPELQLQTAGHCLLKGGMYAEFLIQGFAMLEANLQSNSPDCAELAQRFMEMLLSVLKALVHAREENDRTGSDDPSLACELRDYINRNFARNFTLTDLAQRFHVSRYHIIHVFSDAFHCSPMQYRTRRRIGEAQVLLMETNLSITYIASMVGFEDPNWFTQKFSQVVGMSPSQFRRESAAKNSGT